MHEWLRNKVHQLLQLTHGRTTAFFVGFFISGNTFAAFHRLDHVYVEFMIGLGGLVIGHSWKEDKAAQMLGPRPLGGPDGADSQK